MNQLIAMNAEVTMSSLDFLSNVINPARLAAGESELRNSEMIRKIEAECDDLEGLQIFSNPLGTDQKYYELTIDQMTLVGMRESKAVRRNVLAKLKEMEIPKVPQTYAAALLEAGRLALELEQAEAQLAIAAPKAAIVDRVMERTNLLNATQVGQQFGMSAVAMNRHLDNLGCVYSKGVKRGRVFQQNWLTTGFGEMKQTEQGYPQALFTTSGAMRVIEILTSEGVI